MLSSGEEMPLCEGGAEKPVTDENLAEFLALMLETRRQEAREQVAAVREGFLTVIDQKTEILDFISWSSLEVRCTGKKEVSVERLKSITTLPNYGSDHRVIERFWRVFEGFTNVERTRYLRFVWGRPWLPVDLSKLSLKHQVRLMNDMNKNAFP